MTGPTLLVLRALGLGDLLTAVPALRALAAAFPEHSLVLATPAALAPLARHIGVVDRVAPLASLDDPTSLPQSDVAVDLHGRGPQSHRRLLATRPRRLIAFRHDEVPESRFGPEWRSDEHDVDRWCRLLRESGIPADPTRLHLDSPAASSRDRDARGVVVLHPGAKDAARRWPAERWVDVVRHVARTQRVLVTAGPAEIELATGVAEATPKAAVLAGDVMELAAAVGVARLVVCGDTGIAHLATALRTPSVVLFGPSSPTHWGPRPSDRAARHEVLWAGRTGDSHGTKPFPGLLEITVDDVVAAIDDVMADDGRRPGQPARAPFGAAAGG